MPKGKLQSPFCGRYELLDPDHPILYPRWNTEAAGKPESSQPKKRKASPGAAVSPAATGTATATSDRGCVPTVQPLSPDDSSVSLQAQPPPKRLELQHNDIDAKGAKRPAGSSGPGNAEEAVELRLKLGYTAAASGRPAEPNGFGFGFELERAPQQHEPTGAAGQGGSAPAPASAPHLQTPPIKRQKLRRSQQQHTNDDPPGGGPAVQQEPLQEGSARPVVPRRVFVGGMPFSMEEEDIREYWSECGAIEDLDLMRFPDTGRFKGIAFITFEEEDAYKAALECNSEPLQGQVLRVEPCYSAGARASSHKPLPSSPDKASGRQKAPAPKMPGYHVAYAGNLPYDVSAQQLKDAFRGCSVTKVRLHTDRRTGRSKGFAHVHFADESSLDRAIQLDGQELEGRSMKVGYAQPKDSQSSQKP